MSTSDPGYNKLVKNDFGILSQAYDTINNFMSLGTDRQFRYIAIKNSIQEGEISKYNFWLDVGTGTGHLANELGKQKDDTFVLGLDVSFEMIDQCKLREIYRSGRMNMVLGDAEKTPFRKGAHDGLISGFVGRHFRDYNMTLKEHHRIIRPNGRLMMLEMGRRATRFSFFIDIYVGKMMSGLGKLAMFLLTGGNAPFRLLEETYLRYHSPKELLALYQQAGFNARYKLIFLGSIVIILAKPLPTKRVQIEFSDI